MKTKILDGKKVLERVFPSDVQEGRGSIPEDIQVIEDKAFYKCTVLTQLILPAGLTRIGEDAFGYCSSLTDLKIPDSVTSIGKWAFYFCIGLTQLTLPNKLTHIRKATFYRCYGLTQIMLPDSLTHIEDNAFYRCSGLTQIKLPDSVIHIGEDAFDGCSGLTDLTLPKNLTHIAPGAFIRCSGLINLKLPNSLTHIGENAFSRCTGLTQLTLPSGMTHIGAYAFSACVGLIQITLPNSLTHIGEGAFYGCSGLTHLTLPVSVTHIGADAFGKYTNLTHIILDTNDVKEFVRLKNLLPESLRAHVTPFSIEMRQKDLVAQFNKLCPEEMLYKLQDKIDNKNVLAADVKGNITNYLVTPEAVQLKKALEAIRPIPGLPLQQKEMTAYEALLQVELEKHIMLFKLKHSAWRLQEYVNIIDAQIIKARAARSTASASSSSSASPSPAVSPPQKPTNPTYITLQKLILELQQGKIPTLSSAEKQALQKPALLNRISPTIKEQLGLPPLVSVKLFNTSQQQLKGAHIPSLSSAAP